MTSSGTELSFLTAMPATTMLLAAVETADAALDAAFESAANIFRRAVSAVGARAGAFDG